MAINKNFSVKNGLEVNKDLVYADADTKRVGINTDNPEYNLHVLGLVGVSTITVNNNLDLNGAISAGSSVGSPGQYLISTGTGVAWQSLPNTRQVQTVTASASQSTFPVTYLIGLIDVFINGVKLSNHEYTADNGTSVSLNAPCFGGETVEFVVYSAFNVSGISTNGITIKQNGSIIGNGSLVNTIDFVGSAVTSTITGFAVTVTTPANYWGSNNTGINTSSNVGIGTTIASSALTVSGDASISGVITATSFSQEGGTSAEFLKADGSVDSNSYLIDESDTLDSVTGRNNVTNNDITVGIITATGGFISVANTTPIQITLENNILTFTAVGIGSTSLTLS